MRATFKLLNSYFLKTIYGPILAFLFPSLLIAILGNIMRIEYIFPGIMAMAVMFIGVLALPLALMELKQSSLFKFIGASPVNNKRFTFVVILYYIFIMFLAIWLLMGMTMLIFRKDVFPGSDLKSASHGIYSGIYTWKGTFSFIAANLLHMLLSVAIGMLIATFSKTPQQALTIGLIIVIPSMFLSGMVLSVDIIGQSKYMQWASRFSPFRYSTGNLIIASTPRDQIGDMLEHLSFDERSVLFNHVVPNVAPATPSPDSYYNVVAGQNFEGTNIQAHYGDVYFYANISPGVNKFFLISDMAHLKHYMNILSEGQVYGTDSAGNIIANDSIARDAVLFKLAFANDFPRTDNNIFNFTEVWGVRRIPEIDSLKDFITQYFRGEDGKGGNTQRFIDIYDNYIVKDNYGWLNAFFKQTNVLYFKSDRILNIFLPLGLSIGFITYSVKTFKWSVK